jgi:DNA-binding transcriptional MerR regulator
MALTTYQTVSIGEAARQTNTSVKKLRYWAESGYINEPERVVCGERSYRQFTTRDLEAIRRINELMAEGYTLKAAAKIAAPKKKGGQSNEEEK